MTVAASIDLDQIQNILNINYSQQQAADATIHPSSSFGRLVRNAPALETFEPIGQKFVIRVRNALAGGFGGIGSSGQLPTPTSTQHQVISVKPIWHSGQISADLRALRINGNQRAIAYSFVNQVSEDIEGLLMTAKDYFETNFFSSTPGQIASVGAGSTSTYVTDTAVTNVNKIDNITQGMRIEIRDATLADSRGTYTVTRTEVTNATTRVGTVYLSGDHHSDGIDATDVIYLEYVYNQQGGELIGLPTAIADSGNYPDFSTNDYINRDTAGNGWYRSQVYDASGDSDPEDSFAEFMSQMQNYGFSANADGTFEDRGQFIVANYLLKNRIGLDTQNQFMQYMKTENGMTPDIGKPIFNPLTYAGFSFFPATKCDKTTAYFVDPSTWAYGKLMEAAPTGSLIGNPNFQLQPGTVWATAGYIWGFQLFCKNPRLNGKITGLTVTPLAGI